MPEIRQMIKTTTAALRSRKGSPGAGAPLVPRQPASRLENGGPARELALRSNRFMIVTLVLSGGMNFRVATGNFEAPGPEGFLAARLTSEMIGDWRLKATASTTTDTTFIGYHHYGDDDNNMCYYYHHDGNYEYHRYNADCDDDYDYHH